MSDGLSWPRQRPGSFIGVLGGRYDSFLIVSGEKRIEDNMIERIESVIHVDEASQSK